jgi:hypothetical protein
MRTLVTLILIGAAAGLAVGGAELLATVLALAAGAVILGGRR